MVWHDIEIGIWFPGTTFESGHKKSYGIDTSFEEMLLLSFHVRMYQIVFLIYDFPIYLALCQEHLTSPTFTKSYVG